MMNDRNLHAHDYSIFYISSITDVEEGTTLNIISNLLTDGETSPFYQALLEANIGSDYAPVVG
jgi:Zn-dependent M16 (insulinase) family peptidase